MKRLGVLTSGGVAPGFLAHEAAHAGSPRPLRLPVPERQTRLREPSTPASPGAHGTRTMDLCLGILAGFALVAVARFQWNAWRLGRVRTAYRQGDVALALRRLEAMGAPSATRPTRFVEFLNIYVASGQYLRALLECERLYPRGFGQLRRDPAALIVVNVSEALGELGRHDEAASILDVVVLSQTTPFTAAGVRMHRAWLLQASGEPARALELMTSISPELLKPDYSSEYHFVRCAALTSLDRFADAHAALTEARRVCTRASAERNALFLEAALLQREGRTDEALDCYARAASHRYRGQGGRALVEWGRLLLEKGRTAEARQAFAWSLERDPECESAREAKALLEKLPAEKPASAL